MYMYMWLHACGPMYIYMWSHTCPITLAFCQHNLLGVTTVALVCKLGLINAHVGYSANVWRFLSAAFSHTRLGRYTQVVQGKNSIKGCKLTDLKELSSLFGLHTLLLEGGVTWLPEVEPHLLVLPVTGSSELVKIELSLWELAQQWYNILHIERQHSNESINNTHMEIPLSALLLWPLDYPNHS